MADLLSNQLLLDWRQARHQMCAGDCCELIEKRVLQRITGYLVLAQRFNRESSTHRDGHVFCQGREQSDVRDLSSVSIQQNADR